MADRFYDSFDRYDTAQLPGQYNNLNGAKIVPGSGRFGGRSLQIDDDANNGFVLKTLDAQQIWGVCFSVQPSGFPATNTVILKILDAGAVQLDLRVYSDGTLALTRNGTALSGGKSVLALSVGAWYFIEVKVKISSSIAAHDCKVNVNNVNWIDVTAGQNSQATADASANAIWLSGTAKNCNFDDLVIYDGTGVLGNGIHGDCKLVVSLPSGAGDETDWTAVGAPSNWQAVNSVPPVGDSKYVSDAVVNDFDLYNTADLGLTGTILGVQTSLYARRDDSSARTMAAIVKSAGNVYAGAAFSPGTSYQFFNEVRMVDPATSAAWLTGAIDALQIGQKIVS